MRLHVSRAVLADAELLCVYLHVSIVRLRDYEIGFFGASCGVWVCDAEQAGSLFELDDLMRKPNCCSGASFFNVHQQTYNEFMRGVVLPR